MSDRLYFDGDGHAHVHIDVIDWMRSDGGAFSARLSGLYYVATQGERDRLVRAFIDYFQHAEEMLSYKKRA